MHGGWKQSQSKVQGDTYPAICERNFEFNFSFLSLSFGHHHGLCATNTAWGHTMQWASRCTAEPGCTVTQSSFNATKKRTFKVISTNGKLTRLPRRLFSRKLPFHLLFIFVLVNTASDFIYFITPRIYIYIYTWTFTWENSRRPEWQKTIEKS